MNEMIFKRLIIFSIVFVQIFIAFNPARAMDSIVDDAPPVDESKPYIPVTADNLQDMTAQAAILIDATTGRVLYEKNPDAKAMPASTTKMMTCILGLENANDDDIVEVDKRAVGVEGSAIYINEGDKIKMSELLQATMLASGNDGAAAIAYYVGKGSLETFVQMMNDKAKEIGATNTHFNNPHGLTDPNHYTTAQKNGVTLIAVVLKTSDSRARFVEGRALLDYGFKHIKEMKTVDEQKLISSIYTHNSTNYKTTVKPIQPFTYLVMDTDNVDDFSWKMNLPAYIDAPLKQGAKVGTVDLLYQGNVVGSVDMVTTEEVTEGFNLLGFLHKLFFS